MDTQIELKHWCFQMQFKALGLDAEMLSAVPGEGQEVGGAILTA